MKSGISYFIFFILLSSPVIASGYKASLLDTIVLKEVECTYRSKYFNAGQKEIKIDTSVLNNNFSTNLDEIISTSSSIYIQSNGGTGNVSGAFIRGTNSYQTSVNWNGFPINSMTLGTYDLSLASTGLMQEISIKPGASGSIYGNGTCGGAIDLDNEADWDNRFSFRLSSLAGSFHERYNSFFLSAGSPRIQFSGRFYFHSGTFNFPYQNIYERNNPLISLENNALNQYGMIHNVFLKLPGNVNIEAGVWYYSKGKEIPAIMGSKSNAFQKDSSLKTYFRLLKMFRKSFIQCNLAFFNDYQLYTDKISNASTVYSIYSHFQTRQYLNDLNYRYYLNDHFSFDIGGTGSFISAETNNYKNRISEQRFSFLGGLKISYPKVIVDFTFRKEFHSKYKIIPVYSASFKYKIIEELLSIKSNFSRNFRVPTMNDRYWTPGGNSTILPESGWNGDFGFSNHTEINQHNELNVEITAFTSVINNIIQWIQIQDDSSNQWTPQNTKKVWARGLESSIQYNLKSGNLVLKSTISYNLTKSTVLESYLGQEVTIGKSLRYVPLHSFNGYIDLTIKQFYLYYSLRVTGKRYSDEENIEIYSMPLYSISNIGAGYKISRKKFSGNLSFKINNLFNAQYQVVRAYPMPGRAFLMSLSVGIGK